MGGGTCIEFALVRVPSNYSEYCSFTGLQSVEGERGGAPGGMLREGEEDEKEDEGGWSGNV